MSEKTEGPAASAAKDAPANSNSPKTSSSAKAKSAPKKPAPVKARKAAKKPAAKRTAVKKPAPAKAPRVKKTAAKPAKLSGFSAAKKAITGAAQQTASSAVRGQIFDFLKEKSTLKPMEKAMAQGKNQFEHMTREATEATRETTEALTRLGTVMTKGLEDIVRTSVSLAQSSAEKQATLFKQALSCRTLNELTETQNKIMKTNFDDMMASATKLSEMSVKLMMQSIEPLNNQMTKSMQKAGKSMAA